MDYYQERGGEPVVMTLRMDSQVLRSLILCSSVLGIKYFVSVAATIIPNRLCGDIPPEDKPLWEKIFGKGIDKEAYKLLKDRFERVVRNDLENIPIGLGLLWMAGLVTANAMPTPEGGPSPAAQSVIQLTQVFTVSRLAHSLVFYTGTAYARTFAFMGGFVSSLGAGCIALQGLAGL
mmetsp:Transcript_18329/g.23600  ORF Transcript_18329/g.23600 Transcript_18329/m.23600 type:complete len:177 (+) Transcript_18329:112-642(+)|eukprot:CAMPEP_0198142930 /NCGR_PEP_ID=MMETSP1443-20131203/5586_1 /TAXON_ID=186043 /ORGANISM="Entomoneis sp., Strain CCMP2396" /LENGTH=176 /DNA_ID=CAMNT_0043806057 /DNA_START=112 /DNA_END=642 /DNA_ORIENTATION=+